MPPADSAAGATNCCGYWRLPLLRQLAPPTAAAADATHCGGGHHLLIRRRTSWHFPPPLSTPRISRARTVLVGFSLLLLVPLGSAGRERCWLASLTVYSSPTLLLLDGGEATPPGRRGHVLLLMDGGEACGARRHPTLNEYAGVLNDAGSVKFSSVQFSSVRLRIIWRHLMQQQQRQLTLRSAAAANITTAAVAGATTTAAAAGATNCCGMI